MYEENIVVGVGDGEGAANEGRELGVDGEGAGCGGREVCGWEGQGEGAVGVSEGFLKGDGEEVGYSLQGNSDSA